MPPARPRLIVNAVMLRGGAVLLARRSPHRKAYPGLWSFPGGHAEAGEGADAALAREMREEIGLAPRIARHLGDIADPGGTALYRMMLVTGWDGGEPRIIDREHTALRWVPVAEAAAWPDLALEAYRPLLAGLLPSEPRGRTSGPAPRGAGQAGR